MILVTGAAGKTGRAIIQALSATQARVRALVHRPEQAAVVAALGAAEVQAGDMRQRNTMATATKGVRTVYHICPNVSPDEVAIGQVAIEASRDAGVDRFVYHSVLHPQVEAMPHHWRKLRVEELLLSSGLPFTVLQPAAYMQNLLAQWDTVLATGAYTVPYAPETRLGMVDLLDVAEAAARVLTETGHERATYELAGPDVHTQEEVASALERCMGRPVRVETQSANTWEQGARAAGLGDYQVDTLLAMFNYYEMYGFWGSPTILAWLLGREPTDLGAFVDRIVSERGGALQKT